MQGHPGAVDGPRMATIPMTRPLDPAVGWAEALGDPPRAVEAGTLLATAPPGAAATAGTGVVSLPGPGGVVELRAARDGVPAREGEGVAIAAPTAIEGTIRAGDADRHVLGALRVGGHVGAGRTVGATGAALVAGMLDRAVVRAGGGLVVEGRVGGSIVEAGAVAEMRRALAGQLRAAPAELTTLAQWAAQLADAAGARGLPAPAVRALAALLGQRHPDLLARLLRAEAGLAVARRAWPGLAPALAVALAAARATVADPSAAPDPLARIAAAARFLTAATAAPAGDPPGIRLPSAHGSHLSCPGSLRVTGTGLTDCDAEVGGDLVATAAGGVIRGGHLRIGGRLLAGELCGRPAAPLRIELLADRPGEELVRAGALEPGVEIRIGHEVVRSDRRLTDVRIAVEGGRAVLTAR